MLDYLVVLLIGVFLIFFLILLNQFFPKAANSQNIDLRKESPKAKRGSLLVCPICFHRREKGEKVYAKSLPLPDGKTRVEVQGCDYCVPKERKCPRCESVLGKNDVVFGLLIKQSNSPENQLTNKPKDRLHIEGCMNCFKR